MEEWRLCVSDFETTAKFWSEEVMTSNVFSIHDIKDFNTRILEIENFIYIKNQNQCHRHETLHELYDMIFYFYILLVELALKYILVSIRRTQLLVMMIKFSIICLTYIILFLFF